MHGFLFCPLRSSTHSTSTAARSMRWSHNLTQNFNWNLILISCLHVGHNMVQSNKLDTSKHKLLRVYPSHLQVRVGLQIRLQFRLGITKINQDVVINNCDVLLSRDPAQHPMLSIESQSTSSTFLYRQSRADRWVLHPCWSKSSIADVWV